MNVSLVICSYNPTMHVAYTLDSLLPQSEQIYQLVVVIDNDKYSDYASTITAKYTNSFNLLTVHVQQNSGRAAARNAGAKLSKGDLILFLDDDMIAEDRLVENHLAYHLANPDSIVIGNGFRNPVYARDDFSKYLVEIERSWSSSMKDKVKVDYANFSFTACNMSIPASQFQRLNGFDSQLKDAEDFDLGVRALWQEITIFYDRSLLAWHNDWPDLKSFIARQNEYTLAKKRLAEIHPEYIKQFPGLLAGKSSFLKKLQSFIYRNTLGMIVVSNPSIFGILPQDFKFSLYRSVISANSLNNKW
jgi:GT2 family glycosyltransferase